MGDKLNKLIKEVDLKEEYYTYFKDSDVIKVIVYDDNEQYDFIISNKFILPLSVYNELLLCLKKCFNNVRLYIDVKDIDYSLVTEYFSSILKDIALDMAKYNVFLDRNITLVDKTLRIDAYNKWEKQKEEWLKLYRNLDVVPGKSSKACVSWNDEWLCEAYMETDYSLINENDFEQVVRDYVAYLVKSGDLDGKN